jgi:lipoprotein-releasing system ATP-binding protein
VAEFVVEMRAVHKIFHQGLPIETEVLHGVDLQLKTSEFCAVMGPSGSGKSTLLNIIGLLDRPSSGSLSICGEETTAMNDHELTRLRGHSIGFVFQSHYLIPAFTALENVMMPMVGNAEFPNAAMAVRAKELLDEVGLKPWCDSLVNHLSGGQQQRVAVARALAMTPPLVLADEPTGNLDSQSAEAVFTLFRKVNREQGTAILFVTHNAALAERCDKIIQVVDGKLIS